MKKMKGVRQMPTQRERKISQRKAGARGGFQRKRGNTMAQLIDAAFKPLEKP